MTKPTRHTGVWILFFAALIFLAVLLVLAVPIFGPSGREVDIEGLRERAAQGSAPAQFRLGGLYFKGEGVTEDYEETVKWFRKAAEQGHASAQTALGWLCCVAVLMRRQDELDARTSQLFGGEGYTPPKGEWIECDVVEAYAWLSLAVAQGEQAAAEQREIIREQMTAAEIIQAQGLASELRKRIETSKTE